MGKGGSTCFVLSWCNSCHLAKVVDQMRLIIIAGISRNVRPFHSRTSIKLRDHILKTADPAVSFWREPYSFIENLNKSLRAVAGFLRNVVDSRKSRLQAKLIECIGNDRMIYGSSFAPRHASTCAQ